MAADNGAGDWLEDLRAHVPVTVSSAQVLHALSGARLPCDRFAYGGSEWGKFFVLDAGGELREVAGDERGRETRGFWQA